MKPRSEDLHSFFTKPSLEEEVCWDSHGQELKLKVIREDLLHEGISGNKFRKLKHHLLEYVKEEYYEGIVTFGGAFSNHIAATAAAGEIFKIPTVGIIRGDEEIARTNPTLKRALACGMKLIFVDRETYRSRSDIQMFKLKYPLLHKFLWIPEGGSGEDGQKGVEEWFQALSFPKNAMIHVACGTGTTLKGMMLAQPHLSYRGYLAVKDTSVQKDVLQLAIEKAIDLEISMDFVGKGYARISEVLCNSIQDFYTKTGVKLDPVYTGKALLGVCHQMKQPSGSLHQHYFIHTGGMQGWGGYPDQKAKVFG